MGCALVFCIATMLIPIISWLIINQEWHFQIPIIDITYKPWRLYVVACSIPEIITGIIFVFLPESPKFVLGQGDKAGAYEILKKMNRWNNGKKSQLEPFDLYEELESAENRERILECKNSRFPLLKSVWIQTAPLFKPPYLLSTVLICTIQFGTYATYNGFFFFFIDINNKMAANLDSIYDQRIAMCDAINMKPANTSTVGNDMLVGDEVSIKFV